MKTKRIVKVIAMLLALCMSLSACGQYPAAEAPENQKQEQPVQNVQQEISAPVTNLVAGTDFVAPKQGSYNEGVVLVKSTDPITDEQLQDLGCVSAQPLYAGAQWYILTLVEGADTVQAVDQLRQLDCFDAVDYDYIMKADTNEPEVIASGECGASVVWELTEDGVLTISGTGTMNDFHFSSHQPWRQVRDQINTVVVEEGITTIGSSSFAYSAITSVSLPSTLTKIGSYAFEGMTLCNSLTIPANVTEIGIAAFTGATGFEEFFFLGDAPYFGEGIWANAFANVVATAYYPGNNPTWTEDVRQDYHGQITWIPYDAPTQELPNTDQQPYLDAQGVTDAWEYLQENGQNPGGSPDVIVAVIDTGVDYNHEDLRNNIWINTAEIPDNGIDDDGNGYVDDIYGWNCVGDNNAPLDDNGHGTHVAGIVAAENNSVGGVGIAYNCKIMALKAGSSSGFFNSSDIAEAIQYAYMNGASVINMSFGGSSISIAVEEALKAAYNQCVLVAAAGNNGMCNQPECPYHVMPTPATPFYPASLQYVIGVMSCDQTGSSLSAFSNFDHYPYNNYEYDVVACGEDVYSTWPNNKYTNLYGTSMAAPVVSGMAAILRSTFTDREMYSTKFITAQLVSTTSRDSTMGIANLYTALTEVPEPFIYNIYDCYIFDNVELSDKNNGNGVIDAGETIRLAIELQNRGGMASNVVAKIDTIRNDDPDLTDPYFTFVNDTIEFSDIGTYSVRDCGKLYDADGNWIGTEKYFEIIVSEDCPNSYLAALNIRLTYQNGLDETDETVYDGEGTIYCNVNRGYHLSGTILTDTVFEADRLYIVSSDVVIPEGVTVTFKEGCQIQFYDNREYYNSPRIIVYGTLNFEGTEEKMVKIAPDAHHENFVCKIVNEGTMHVSYLYAVNLNLDEFSENDQSVTDAYIDHSYFVDDTDSYGWLQSYHVSGIGAGSMTVAANAITSSVFIFSGNYNGLHTGKLQGCFLAINSGSWNRLALWGDVRDNIFYSYWGYYPNSSVGVSNYYCFGNYYVSTIVENNIFMSADDNQPNSLINIDRYDSSAQITYVNNTFSKGYQKYASQVIEGYYDASGHPTVDVFGACSDLSALWPHVVSVEMFDKDGNPITRVGKEAITVRVTFNRPMAQNEETFISFGTVIPYDDYRINGAWISDTVWEGTYTLKAEIENGRNFLKAQNAYAAEDSTQVVFGEFNLHEFTIDTTAAMSMNLQAVAADAGINLTWFQDDYDTLLGYNIYRSEEKDGYYTKLNPAILLPTDESFLDENAEPGKTYWYTYTVVLTDFSESAPAGKVYCTAMDTIQPNIYHTPVNQGYANNNLVISCTASDNISIASVTLYYRTIGADSWKSLTMSKQNDKYSATIFGSDVTLAGLEYYIVAIDGGGNTVAKGSAETPYTVLVKDASVISRLGDVNGDGTVTTKDALMIMQAINGDLRLTDDEFKRADLNKDGILSSMEALRILQYINGNVTTLEM